VKTVNVRLSVNRERVNAGSAKRRTGGQENLTNRWRWPTQVISQTANSGQQRNAMRPSRAARSKPNQNDKRAQVRTADGQHDGDAPEDNLVGEPPENKQPRVRRGRSSPKADADESAKDNERRLPEAQNRQLTM